MQPVRLSDGRVVGELGDDGVFRKKVKGSRHLFRQLDAWGMDAAALNSLPDGTEIRIKDADDGTVYYTSKESWLGNGETRNFAPYGKQVFLPRKLFNL